MAAKVFQSIKFILVANFTMSVMLLIVGCLLSLSDRYSLFEFNQDLYGELISNVKITLIYVAITEIIICAYCFFSKNIHMLVIVS